MKKGIYYVEFKSSRGRTGDGIIVLGNGAINGGDGGYYYRGRYKIDRSGIFAARLEIKRHKQTAASVFGPVPDYELAVHGRLADNGQEFDLVGAVPQTPADYMKITGRRIADVM